MSTPMSTSPSTSVTGRYMATADLGEDSWDVGVDDTPVEAVRAALRTLGEPHASDLAAGVEQE